MTLPTAVLGRTGETVSRLGFGAMELIPFTSADQEKAADRLLGAVLDHGIVLIDTAPDYGASEALIGKHLAHRRDAFFLASKCGCLVDREPKLTKGKLEHDFSRANVRKGVEQSLRRLRTDRLDLVQIHSSPPRRVIEAEDTVAELTALRDEGKLRFIGMSSVLPDIEDHVAMDVFDTFQLPWSLLQPEHEDMIAAAARAGAGTIVRGGVARGAPAPDHDSSQQHAFWRRFVAERQDLWGAAGLDELLDGQPRMSFLLRFVLGHPDVHTTIVGTANPEHLAANVEAARQGPLPEDVWQEARRRVDAARARRASDA